MKTPEEVAEALLGPVLAAPRKGRRKLVAIAGPPASGKSTVSTILARRLTGQGCSSQVVPMDGFHLDNTVLTQLGLLDRKGAPETFDATGFLRLVAALANEEQVFYPTFDRDRDLAIGGSGIVIRQCDTVLVEGNYLLFDAPIWREFSKYWDLSVFIDETIETLENRLINRWHIHGLSPSEAKRRVQSNDLQNAKQIKASLIEPSIVLPTNCGEK